MNFTPISIESKHIFDEFFHKYPPVISELTFTNLYVWRNSRSIEYAIHNDILILRASYGGARYFFPPIGENRAAGYETAAAAAEECGIDMIKLIPERDGTIVQDLFADTHILTEDRDNFDYVYAADKP